MAQQTQTGLDGAAVREMALIHRIFRAQFAALPPLVTEVDPGDRDRVRAVAGHVEFLLDGLHMHHTTEDDLVWPKLLDRAALEAPRISRMEDQHARIDTAVADVRRRTTAWTSAPDRETASALAESIDRFREVLVAHLDEEERDVVPLIEQHLSPAEWQQVGKQAFAKFTPAQRWIATGQLIEVATPAEAAAMFATLPWPVRVLWRLVGRRTYRRYIEPVRGVSA